LKLKLISRRGTMSKTLKLLTSMLFFQHWEVSLQFCTTGLFTLKWVFFPLENANT
jgi:hypothetical protein